MTKKDYELIARVLRARRETSHFYADGGGRAMWSDIVYELSKALRQDNNKFKFSEFIVACGALPFEYKVGVKAVLEE